MGRTAAMNQRTGNGPDRAAFGARDLFIWALRLAFAVGVGLSRLWVSGCGFSQKSQSQSIGLQSRRAWWGNRP